MAVIVLACSTHCENSWLPYTQRTLIWAIWQSLIVACMCSISHQKLHSSPLYVACILSSGNLREYTKMLLLTCQRHQSNQPNFLVQDSQNYNYGSFKKGFNYYLEMNVEVCDLMCYCATYSELHIFKTHINF